MVKESFDLIYIINMIPRLCRVLPVTLFMALVAALLGYFVGLLLTFCKVGHFKGLRKAVNGITVAIRGIPTIVLLYIVYFGFPKLVKAVWGVDIGQWSKWTFVIIALAIEIAATCSEMFRSAYNSLDRGQLEAAHSIGMTKLQCFFRMILPQGLYVILPNLGSATLSLIQGTALAYTLGIMDVMGTARMLDTNAFGLKTFESYVTVALFYWGISIVVGWIFKGLESYFGRGQKNVASIQK